MCSSDFINLRWCLLWVGKWDGTEYWDLIFIYFCANKKNKGYSKDSKINTKLRG